ncbi:MAG TPA: ATP-binding protein [Planctomycetaceae bacterium]|nr:ATP-binding protein [Planctomycetaceae bacterium]
MTLTTRVSSFVLALLSLVLIGFSLTLYLLSGRYLHGQVDERLDGTLSALCGAVEQTRYGLEWEPTKRQAGVGESPFGLPVLWFVEDRQGQILDRSTQPETDELIKSRPIDSGTARQSADTLEWRSGPWRLRQRWIRAERDARPVKPGKKVKNHRELRITVATSLNPVHAALTQLAITLAGLSAGILLVALIAVRIVCRRVLAPVSRMAVAASTIGADDLSRRLPAVATSDEVGQLNRAFNGLLDRLQESFERQRRFTGEASHQIRTPLAGILGQIEVALRRDRSTEEYRRVLTGAYNRANHLSKIVESLLFLARANGDAALTAMETLCLNSWLPEQLEPWSEHSRATDIVLQLNEAEPCMVRVQTALLGELLNILVDNACKYSVPGTPIEIALDRDDGAVRIQVRDRGCGVAADDLPHLFTQFFRGDEARRQGIEGTGLGLSIAWRLARLFGGELTVESSVGVGSCFTLRLPEVQTSESRPAGMAFAQA